MLKRKYLFIASSKKEQKEWVLTIQDTWITFTKQQDEAQRKKMLASQNRNW